MSNVTLMLKGSKVVFAAFMQMHTDTPTWCTAYMPLTSPNYKVIAGKMHSQFPFLKYYGHSATL